MSVSARVYRLAVVTLFVAFVGGLISSNEEAAVGHESTAPASFNAAGAPTVEFTLPDMMCEDGCAWTVNDILSKQPGAKDVHVDFEAKAATVAIEAGTFDSQLALAELVDKGFGNSQLKGDLSGDKSTLEISSDSTGGQTPIKPRPRSVSHRQGDKTAQ